MEVPNRLGKQDIMRDKDFMLKLCEYLSCHSSGQVCALSLLINDDVT